jgi:ATP/ADP translocase
MSLRRRISERLDIREGEFRIVGLSFAGAFLVMSFLILTRSLREAFYLGRFAASTLPYITGATVVLGLPAAGLFSRALTRLHPQTVLRRMILGLGLGLIVLVGLLRLAETALAMETAIVAFYLWTALGSLLLASGFWLVVSELFAVREAKRLFGFISAGGTLGTLVTGISLTWLVTQVRPVDLVPILLAVLAAVLVVNELVPRDRLRPVKSEKPAGRERALTLVWNSRHLRLIALIVLAIGATSAMIDYQFKEAAQATLETDERLAGFLGAFYGWTGGLALAVQLLVTSRLLASAGVSWSLALLPLALLVGSTGMLVAPGILIGTFLRGTDNTLGKSLFRSVMEFLWVPVPAFLRRRTKTVIDSLVDSVGEGLGALVVFLWVTLPGLPSRYLSVFVLLALFCLLYLSRRMGHQYFVTLRTRLEESGEEAALPGGIGLDERGLLGATLTRLDVTQVFASEGIRAGLPGHGTVGRESEEPAGGGGLEEAAPTLADTLAEGDTVQVAAALAEPQDWTAEHVPALARLLARDVLVTPVVRTLVSIGSAGVPHLSTVLAEEGADFVIRRRVPRVLAGIDDPAAEEALVKALGAGRFEIRYGAALALQRRRSRELCPWEGDWRSVVWEAVRSEVSRDRPVWELARLLDDNPDDELVGRRVGLRGELSLEHTFRLLSLVLDPTPIRTAYRGILLDDAELKSFALEYLEQALPVDIRRRLWPFIGDLSASEERRSIRRLDDVVSDLLKTGATLFASEESRRALRRVLEADDRGDGPEGRDDRPEGGEGEPGGEGGR